ncbi:MAG: hypothetical protein ACRDHV_07355 [Actinomycetota bacterium]
MRAPKTLLLLAVLAALLSVSGIAAAQETPTPGVTPEEVRGWTFYLFALPIALATVGVVAMIGVLYFRYSTRFFGREEPPAPVRRRRPQFAGVAPRVEQVGAASTTPPAAPAAEVRTAAEQVPQSRPAEAAAEAAPAPAKEEPAPAKEEPAPAKPAPAPSRPAAEHVEPDQATYERELKAQLDKGVDRRVAEGRAKAAAVRAARAGASSAAAPETAVPAVEKAEAETATEAGKDEAPAAKEPEVPPPTAPEAEADQAEEAPTKVKAPRPEPSAPAATEGPPVKVPPGADEETFTRILEEQLAKGLARPIAESRARAAAVKAAREKADAG